MSNQEWLNANEYSPDSNRKVDALVENPYGGKPIRIYAMYLEALTHEAGYDETECEITDYDEEADEHYLKKGWYQFTEFGCEYDYMYLRNFHVIQWREVSE